MDPEKFKFNNKAIFISIVVLALAVGFGSGYYFQDVKQVLPVNRIVINQNSNQPPGVDFGVFWNVWDLLQQKYVDHNSLDTQKMVYGAISGMVQAIGDPYTVFFEPKESAAFNEDINGSFSGVGLEIGIRNNLLTVISPLKDTPAEKAGLIAGDKIIKIGEKSTDGMTVEEAVSLIRGAKGTSVKISILRDDQKTPKEYNLIRDTIKSPTVSWKLVNGNIAYIELSIFNRNVDADFKKASKEIIASKADRIILDLRNNPGGLLDSSVNIASYFLDPNFIVTIERYANGNEDSYKSLPNGSLKKYPLIIITNEGTASASEILAGALKDDRQIKIVGEKTFGKGVVQEVDDLSGGASVKITVAKWFTPNGTSINSNGIKPDVQVARSEDDINNNRDPQLDKAAEMIQYIWIHAYLRNV